MPGESGPVTAIGGFWAWSGASDPAPGAARVLEAQKPYGPHHKALLSDGDIALGRNLFRLLPEDHFDRQPVRAASGCLLVADVRLDNRSELAAMLGLAGDCAKLADVDLLMHALERWDEAALDRIVGDFAFARWDPRARRLLLARDFMGQRPLVYHRGAGFFAFASMAKGLHALPEIPYAPDLRRMADLSALLAEQGTSTFFEGVERVEPGHLALVTPDGVVSRKYWNPALRPLRLPSSRAYAEALREQFDAAVAARLRGGPVAAQLSGGLDSGAVVATAAGLLATHGQPIVAFTSVPREGFAGARHRERIDDEGPLAAATAALYPNIEHVLIRASHRSPLDTLERDFLLYERPVLNLANWAWESAIAAAAQARGLTIMLSGRSGNMGFSYTGMALLPQLLANGRVGALLRQSFALKRGGTRWGTIAAQAIGPFLPGRAWRGIRKLRGIGAGVADHSLIRPDAMAAFDIAGRAAAQGDDLAYQPQADHRARRLRALGSVDFGNYNKGALAQFGVDYRDPTADRRLIEFCLSVPLEEYLCDGIPRSLARRAFADRLPAAVSAERRRGFQAADWHEGFAAARDDIRAEVDRIAACPAAAEVLDVERMRALVEDWPEGSWSSHKTVTAYRIALLRAIANGHFLRKASGSNY